MTNTVFLYSICSSLYNVHAKPQSDSRIMTLQTNMLTIRPDLELNVDEVEITGIRAQGAGGQNVNKVSSAIHLRFDIHQSTLPDVVKQRLSQARDKRITADGVVVLKAQRFRAREKNRIDALDRLVELIRSHTRPTKPRKPTRPSRASRERRLKQKQKRSAVKALRAPPE